MDKKETEIISIGHRNVQGMFYDKKKDLLILVEHGPQGGDEINLNLIQFKKIKNTVGQLLRMENIMEEELKKIRINILKHLC